MFTDHALEIEIVDGVAVVQQETVAIREEFFCIDERAAGSENFGFIEECDGIGVFRFRHACRDLFPEVMRVDGDAVDARVFEPAEDTGEHRCSRDGEHRFRMYFRQRGEP